MAESAIRSRAARRRFPGGLIALDYFGDTDLETPASPGPLATACDAGDAWPVEVLSVSRDLGLPRTTAGLGRGALALTWSAVAVAGGLENRPGLLRLLARRGVLHGNRPEIVARVRDAGRLFGFLAGRGLPHAAVRFDPAAPVGGGAWLFKRRRSAGGGGVRGALPGEPRRPGEFLQERIAGTVGSAVFAAGGGRAAIVGLSEQIDGSAWPGAGPFRYAGNIAGPRGALLAPEGEAMLARAVSAVASRFELAGLNGVDFVLDRGVPRIIEINPRWTASMELFEPGTSRPGGRLGLVRAGMGIHDGPEEAEAPALFDLHLAAIEGAPETPVAAPGRAAGPYVAKAVLYAVAECVAPEPEALAAIGARDRPRAGERFGPGQPVCTLVTAGESRAACLASLAARSAEARRLLGRATRAVQPAGGNVVSSDRSGTVPRRERWPLPARPW